MLDSGQFALINADIDGELDAGQRAELARILLADPQARAVRDGLRRLCQTLDAIELVEPPSGLRDRIVAALPQRTRISRRSGWASGAALGAWRNAAMLAGVLLAGALVVELARSPGPPPIEVVGTIALAPAATLLDTVQLPAKGPITGRVSLYRDRGTLVLGFEVRADTPVAARVASQGRVLEIDHVALEASGPDVLGGRPAVPLPGVAMPGQNIEVTFLSGGHAIGSATLRVPRGP